MASFGSGGFDSSGVDPHVPFEPIPNGKYLCAITASEKQDTQRGDGWFIKLEFTVLEGAYKGRKIFDRLNLGNPSQKAVEIARAKLSAICRATGKVKAMDSVELHDLPLCVAVRVSERKDTKEKTNDVTGYLDKAKASGAVAPPAGNGAAGGNPFKRPTA